MSAESAVSVLSAVLCSQRIGGMPGRSVSVAWWPNTGGASETPRCIALGLLRKIRQNEDTGILRTKDRWEGAALNAGIHFRAGSA